MSTIKTALVVLVPEAEALVEPFRNLHDPSAAAGMPAHITLLYPFKALADEALLQRLGDGFSGFSPFDFALHTVRRFPDVLYLAPEPDEPFRQLTLAVWNWYPEAPPYGGKWLDIVPHLSVAQTSDQHTLDGVASAFTQACAERLPLHAFAAEVALMGNSSGRWRVQATFHLGRQ